MGLTEFVPDYQIRSKNSVFWSHNLLHHLGGSKHFPQCPVSTAHLKRAKLGSGKEGKKPLESPLSVWPLPMFLLRFDWSLSRSSEWSWAIIRLVLKANTENGCGTLSVKVLKKLKAWKQIELISHNHSTFQLGPMNTFHFMKVGQTTNKPPLATHNDGGLTDGDKPKWGEGDGISRRAMLKAAALHVSDALPSAEETLNPWRLLPSSTISRRRRKVSRWVLKTSPSCGRRK